MAMTLSEWIIDKLGHWLSQLEPPRKTYLSDFKIICKKIHPADVLLLDGRSRASRIIKQVTQSPWSHAALYIGQLRNIKDQQLKAHIKLTYNYKLDQQLLIEGQLGSGTIISPIEKYKDDHLRLLRPTWLHHDDEAKVISYALSRLGKKYGLRHLFDLARFLFPWGLYPRRWRSTLFQHNALQPTEDICSSMIADAFHAVHYPILPLLEETDKKQVKVIMRNPRLFTPSDFDFSPFFSVIKYPIFPQIIKDGYANLPWEEEKM
jgi:hypothetical protein